MAVPLISRVGGAVLFLIIVSWLSPSALAQENLVATYGETGTGLAFNVPDAVVQKFLPEGWQLSASNGANLFVTFVERFVVTETMGSHLPARAAVLSILAKKEDVGSTVPMISQRSSQTPLTFQAALVQMHLPRLQWNELPGSTLMDRAK